jgi:hypothetical protein
MMGRIDRWTEGFREMEFREDQPASQARMHNATWERRFQRVA